MAWNNLSTNSYREYLFRWTHLVVNVFHHFRLAKFDCFQTFFIGLCFAFYTAWLTILNSNKTVCRILDWDVHVYIWIGPMKPLWSSPNIIVVTPEVLTDCGGNTPYNWGHLPRPQEFPTPMRPGTRYFFICFKVTTCWRTHELTIHQLLSLLKSLSSSLVMFIILIILIITIVIVMVIIKQELTIII